MLVIESALHLLLRALVLEINKMSTSALALGVGLAVVLVQLFSAYRNGGRGAVKKELRSDTWRGAAVALGLWVLLFCGFVVVAVYQDHDGLKIALSAKSVALESAEVSLREASSQCDRNTSALRQDVAVNQAVNGTLEKQNRDEQILIAGCQSDAIKRLTPEPLTITVIFFDADVTNIVAKRMRWLVLTNRTFSPAHINAFCTQGVTEITSASIQILGGVNPHPGISFGGGINSKLTNLSGNGNR